MDTMLLSRLEAALSVERFQTYRNHTASNEEAVVLYLWNQALAESLYSTIGFLEVALRNAIHTTMAAQTGTQRWIPTVLVGDALTAHYAFMKDLVKRYGSGHSVGQVVAGLTFGKWVHMLKNPRCQWVSRAPYPIFTVFPNYPTRFAGDRNTIHEHLTYILELRNRVMHHEPIFDGVKIPNKGVKTNVAIHDDILEAIGWIDTDLQKTSMHVDRFGKISTDGRQQILDALPARYATL